MRKKYSCIDNSEFIDVISDTEEVFNEIEEL